MLLARRYPQAQVWGIEIQPDLAGLAKENASRNGLESQCTILHGDLRQISTFLPAGRFQMVVSNPPFRPPLSGRISPVLQRAVARQELTLTLADLSRVGAYLLGHGGSLNFIHLPGRLSEIFLSLTRQRLEPKTLRLVSSFRDAPPELALISARKNGRPGLQVLPPLIVFRAPGCYTREVKHALRGQ